MRSHPGVRGRVSSGDTVRLTKQRDTSIDVLLCVGDEARRPQRQLFRCDHLDCACVAAFAHRIGADLEIARDGHELAAHDVVCVEDGQTRAVDRRSCRCA